MNLMALELLFLLLLNFLIFALYFKRRGRIRIWDPAFLFFAMFLLGTAVKLLYFLFLRPRSLTILRANYDLITMGKEDNFLEVGMIFILASVATYCLGLSHGKAVDWHSFEVRGNSKLLTSLAIFVCFLTLGGIVLFLYRAGAFSGGEYFAKRFNDVAGGASQRFFVFDYWLFKGLTLVKYFFYALLISWLANVSRARNTVYALLLVTLLLSLFASAMVGSRAHVVVILLDLLILTALTTRRKVAAWLLVMILMALGFTAATAISRLSRPKDPEVRQENRQRILAERQAAATVIAQRTAEETTEGSLEEGPIHDRQVPRTENLWFTELVGERALRRIDVQMRGRYFLDLFKTAHVVGEVPETLPFLQGQSFVGWLFVLVPNSVWPDKPMFSEMAPLLAREIFLEPNNNVPPGFVAEAWLNFGWGGLFVIGIVGAAVGLIFNSFIRLRGDPVAQVVYAMILSRCSFTLFNSSLGDAILKVAIDCVPVLVLLLVLAKISRTEHPLQAVEGN